jgi:hypothetical protein
MTRSSVAAMLVLAMVVGMPRPAPVWAQDKSEFAGRWTLNRELSQFPREIGFGVDSVSAGGSGLDSTASGGRGRRGSGGGGTGAFTARRGLSPQAAACGLSQGTLETAVSKRLSDAGFKILRNSDEDTYVYVNVITTSLPTGFCVSRYDVFLYTYTTAKLSYQETPVLVQVSLLHKGGIAGGAPAAHAEGVLRGCAGVRRSVFDPDPRREQVDGRTRTSNGSSDPFGPGRLGVQWMYMHLGTTE